MPAPAYRGHTRRSEKIRHIAVAAFCAVLLAFSARILGVAAAYGTIPVPLKGTHITAVAGEQPLIFSAVFLIWVVLALCCGFGAYQSALYFYRWRRD